MYCHIVCLCALCTSAMINSSLSPWSSEISLMISSSGSCTSLNLFSVNVSFFAEFWRSFSSCFLENLKTLIVLTEHSEFILNFDSSHILPPQHSLRSFTSFQISRCRFFVFINLTAMLSDTASCIMLITSLILQLSLSELQIRGSSRPSLRSLICQDFTQVFSIATTTAQECERFLKRCTAELVGNKSMERCTDVCNCIGSRMCFTMLKSILVLSMVHAAKMK